MYEYSSKSTGGALVGVNVAWPTRRRESQGGLWPDPPSHHH